MTRPLSPAVSPAILRQLGVPVDDLQRHARELADELDLEGHVERLLRPLVPDLVGTKSAYAVWSRRTWLILDWLVRVYAPTWLRAAGREQQAVALAGLPEVTPGAYASALPMLQRMWTPPVARTTASLKASAGYAAYVTARFDTSATASEVAYDVAGDAAEVVAKAADPQLLAAIIAELQQSALDLLRRMIAVTPDGEVAR